MDDGRPLRENIVSTTSIVPSERILTTSAPTYRVKVHTTTRINLFWTQYLSMCNLDHLFIGIGHSIFEVGFESLSFAAHMR